jgi:putative flippase GtrA
MKKVRRFKEKHPNLYEFILFNVLANIATLTNFVILNVGRAFLFSAFANIPFSFWLFDYSLVNGGLCGFLSFLLSYACAQTVNFIVQRKLVFGSDKKLGWNVVIYIFFVIIVYIICLYVPTLVVAPLTNLVGNLWATNLANVLNILIQVAIMFPVLKFLVMKKTQAQNTIIGTEQERMVGKSELS